MKYPKTIFALTMLAIIGMSGFAGYVIGDYLTARYIHNHITAQIDYPYRPGERPIGACTTRQFGDYVSVCCPVWH